MHDFIIEPMAIEHVAQAHEIEKATFPTPWSRASLEREVTENACARYLVLREGDEVLGFAGMWFVLDEAHVTNVAIRADARGRGLGEALMRALIRHAAEHGMTWMTLECRRSNHVAQALYRKLGFVDVGYRKRYYEDDNEDALLMALEGLAEGEEERRGAAPDPA
ncbi:MAG: ribosomal protein S18-alanine N-acetyltransferase [Christensenellales bacterium]|jgi:ribosomal-protein-alanine N-acetyltransferase